MELLISCKQILNKYFKHILCCFKIILCVYFCTKYTNCSRDLKWSVAFRVSCVPQHGRMEFLSINYGNKSKPKISMSPVPGGGSTAVAEPYISTLSCPGVVWLYRYGGLPDRIGAIFDDVLLWTEQTGPLFRLNPLSPLLQLWFSMIISFS